MAKHVARGQRPEGGLRRHPGRQGRLVRGAEGELVSLIGANGAGKTTTLKAVTGLQPVAAGEIEFMGRSIKGQGAWDLVKQGLVMVPEGRGTFTRMTITENLQMGAFVRNDNEIEADIDKVFGHLPAPEGAPQPARRHHVRRRAADAAMGRALMARPKVLLLDEPSMGLSPIMVDKIFEVVADIHSRGTTILLVEQNASRALALANRGYVMDSGEITMTGEAKTLLADPEGAGRLSRRVKSSSGHARFRCVSS